MTRLITVEELKADGFINQNLENEYLYSAIDEAQGIFLREIIGDSLYETLQNKLSEANIDGVYQTLLDIYVKIYLKYKVLALLCVPLNFKIRNIGIAQQFSNEVNTTSLEDTKYIQNYYENKADFYANRLTKFLQTNDIPEYKCSSNQITEPNELHPVSSIYLGNSKKRVFFGGSGSSGGGGAVGDVVWGNIKGDIKNQIDLQNELNIKVNRAELARVATTGSFNDLLDKPTIPTKTSELTNDSGFLTEYQPLKTINNESIVGTGNITIESFSGDYNDLTNKPSIPTKTSELDNDSGFLTEQTLKTINGESIVGTGNIEIGGGSGTQVQSDWAETNTESVSYIKNKPTLSIVATSGSFNDLLDKPVIPTKTSELENDSGFLTEHQPLKTINNESIVGTGNITIEGFSGDYNDLTNKPTIPTKTSELTNDSGFLTEHQPLKTINGESLVGTGNIEISGSSQWGSITGNISNQTDLQSELSKRKQDLDLSTLDQAKFVDFYNNTITYQQNYNLNWAGLPIVSISTWNNPDFGEVRLVQYGILGETNLQTEINTRISFKGRLVTSTGESIVWSEAMEFVRVCQTGSYNDLTDKPNLSTVATTGSFNDLLDKPTIPSNTVEMVVEFADGTSTTYNVYIQ